MASENLRDEPPPGANLTVYDRSHLKTYIRLLDADAAGARWEVAVHQLFGRDPAMDPERLERMHRTHLERAKWLRDGGYLQLLQQPAA